MKNKSEIISLFGELIDLYRESEEIQICERGINVSEEAQDLEDRCEYLQRRVNQLVS